MGLVLAALSILVFLEVTVLAVFHCYISFILYKTTLQVIRGESKQKTTNSANLALEEVIKQPSTTNEQFQ